MRNSFLFVIFFVLKALSQDTSEWVRIDCGSQVSYPDESGVLWQTDEDFIKTGKNQMVSLSSRTFVDQYDTLRVFTEQNKNCYSLPATAFTRYFIRAVFLYGNYDGLSNAPTFDLEFDGNKWVTVVTDISKFSYYEMIYVAKGDITSICLARTNDKQFPFISFLEFWPVPDKMYANMTNDRAWFNGYRYNYGADSKDWILGYPYDTHNRFWEPMTPPGSEAIIATFASLDVTTVNDPPVLAIIKAVQAPSPTDKLELSFRFSKMNRLDHVELYFTEPLYTTATRSFNIDVNNEFAYAISPVYQECNGVWINVMSVGTLNIELVATNNSTQPPVISAIEVYTASDPLVSVYTSTDDCKWHFPSYFPLSYNFITFYYKDGAGNHVFLMTPSGNAISIVQPASNIKNFEAYSLFGHITGRYLSGYDLDGPLPDFSQMNALETIDLRNNKLDANKIHVSRQAHNLTLIQFQPWKIHVIVPFLHIFFLYRVGDSKDNQSKGKRLALIIGLAVGLPIFLAFIITVVYLLVRKQKTSTQGQVTAVELGVNQGGMATGQPQDGIVSNTMSPEALTLSAAIEHTSWMSNGDSFASYAGISHIHQLPLANGDSGTMPTAEETSTGANAESISHHPPILHMIDEEELNDLLRRHGQN
ncbi:probable LRR receptor-like protein kinase At1g51890 [Durio zibethinus]|uniref:Probable LRR receptor-like protein kinase At1g51890 n=1 Tax=Durio zibethinus TaxID=66656 RepID=A0A6P5XKH9_DURZI|nr:probable LRR receptor-like protein kinase At1g51890 [Durio zibethinus]